MLTPATFVACALPVMAIVAAVAVVASRSRRRPDGDLSIRPLAAADIVALEGRFANTSGDQLRSKLTAQEAGSASLIIVWLHRRPVAVASVRWDGPSEPAVRALVADCPEIHSVEVDAAKRSGGIGSRLLAVCEGLAIERGFRRVGVSIAVDNVHAYALCLRRGYWEPQRIEYAGRPEFAPDGLAAESRSRFLIKSL